MAKREPEEQTERFQMRVSKGFFAMVDEWRRKQADIPSRTEAIRRLVQLGIDAPAPRKRP
jgi:uncharacterized protein